jgi:hypothetical protein
MPTYIDQIVMATKALHAAGFRVVAGNEGPGGYPFDNLARIANDLYRTPAVPGKSIRKLRHYS